MLLYVEQKFYAKTQRLQRRKVSQLSSVSFPLGVFASLAPLRELSVLRPAALSNLGNISVIKRSTREHDHSAIFSNAPLPAHGTAPGNRSRALRILPTVDSLLRDALI